MKKKQENPPWLVHATTTLQQQQQQQRIDDMNGHPNGKSKCSLNSIKRTQSKPRRRERESQRRERGTQSQERERRGDFFYFRLFLLRSGESGTWGHAFASWIIIIIIF
jgi:hypothetical protein